MKDVSFTVKDFSNNIIETAKSNILWNEKNDKSKKKQKAKNDKHKHKWSNVMFVHSVLWVC